MKENGQEKERSGSKMGIEKRRVHGDAVKEKIKMGKKEREKSEAKLERKEEGRGGNMVIL